MRAPGKLPEEAPIAEETIQRLRIVIADDERPARLFLASILRDWEDVEVVGIATGGEDAIQMIEETAPELALLDLQMPEIDGLSVVRLIRRDRLPLVAFVTAYDEYAVRAFELNAIDYLLKPVEPTRLRQTINRAHEMLERADWKDQAAASARAAAESYRNSAPPETLRRIPIRKRDDIFLLPIADVVSIVAQGELLHLTTRTAERHTISYRLKDLEERLPSDKFIRISRGAVVAIAAIARVTPSPGGTYLITLTNAQQLHVSRIRARVLRETLLRL